MKRSVAFLAILAALLALAGAVSWASGVRAEPINVTIRAGETAGAEVGVTSELILKKTVGTDPALCASTKEITVGRNTAVTYCFEVTNSTSLTFAQHDLVDSALGTILDGFSYALAPQASAFLTQTVLITETTVNTATWTAYNAGPTDVHTATDTATVTVAPPTIAFTKTVGLDPSLCASTKEITVGRNTAVTYCYEVTNTGLTTLTRHDLVDSDQGTILDGLSYALAPQASAFLTQTVLITETTVNTATWTAYNPGPVDVAMARDTATVIVQPPTIAFTKTVGTDSAICASTDEITVGPNTAVTYCYEVTNTGPTALSRHDLVDSALGTILNGFSYALEPQASAFLTQTVLITETTVNTATWTAYNPGPVDVATDTDSATVWVELKRFLPLIRRD
jgi:stress-induced morphogen